jgi:hypothetical protein
MYSSQGLDVPWKEKGDGREKGNDQENSVRQREREMVAWFAGNLHRSVTDFDHGLEQPGRRRALSVQEGSVECLGCLVARGRWEERAGALFNADARVHGAPSSRKTEGEDGGCLLEGRGGADAFWLQGWSLERRQRRWWSRERGTEMGHVGPPGVRRNDGQVVRKMASGPGRWSSSPVV